MRSPRPVALLALFALAACAPPPAAEPPEPVDTRVVDRATIRAAVEQWSAAAQAKDVEGFMSVYADDAVLMLEGAPDLRGVEAIRAGIGGMMQNDPNFNLSFTPDDITVARAGDFAYETGTYSLTLSDAEQAPATQTGYYIVLWEKQSDGTWKVVLDAPVSDPPEAPAEEAAK